MGMVIVTLSFTQNGSEKAYDMEIPCHVPVNILIRHICETLRNYSEGSLRPNAENLRLFCRRLNRMLATNETFEQAGIWNGDYIDLK